MNYKQALLAATLVAAPVAAKAEVNGFYVSLGGGLNLMPSVNENQAYSGVLTPNPGYQINVGTPGGTQGPGPGGTAGPTFYNTGPVIAGSVGYGFSNNTRVELGISYSQNRVTRLNNGAYGAPSGSFATGDGIDPLGLAYTGTEKKLTFMVNVIYDFNDLSKGLGLPFTPYAGIGVGMSHIDWSGVTRTGGAENFGTLGVVSKITNAFYTSDNVLAVQGMVGGSYEIPGVPGLALTADFRVLALPQGFVQHSHLTLAFKSTPTPQYSVITGNGTSNWADEFNYNFVVGLRYAFGAPAPVSPAVVPAVAVPAAAVSRSYLVFFDWDKAVLTDRAKQIVAEAAAASKKVQVTKIEVNGYTDTSGTPAYNKGLSVARAKAVMAELVKDGVPAKAIAIMGYGEANLLVATGPNVREPQNRRVEIIIK